jgi:hypothetical protein
MIDPKLLVKLLVIILYIWREKEKHLQYSKDQPIDVELGKQDHGSSLRNCDQEEAETLDAITDPRTRFNW